MGAPAPSAAIPSRPARSAALEGYRPHSFPPLPTAISGTRSRTPRSCATPDNWHLFCTVRGTNRSHAILYLSFPDWDQANRAPRHILPCHPGFFCAPQVFYFTPHQRWYLICQAAADSWSPNYQPAFSTTTDVAKPQFLAPAPTDV